VGNVEMAGDCKVRECVGSGVQLLGTTRHNKGPLLGSEMLTPLMKSHWAHASYKKPMKYLEVISWPYTIGSAYMAGWRFYSHRRVMKSLLMENVYNLCVTKPPQK
jgi:hypothetical protein